MPLFIVLLFAGVAGSPALLRGVNRNRGPVCQTAISGPATAVPDGPTAPPAREFPAGVVLALVVLGLVVVGPSGHRGGLLHLHEELRVAAGLLQAVQEQLDRLLGLQGAHHPAELP